MKVVKSFSIDAKLLADIEEFLKNDGDNRSIHIFCEDALARELARSQRIHAKEGSEQSGQESEE